jgi:predicted dehydrogenase
MISDQAFFVKDIMTPKGSVSIVVNPGARSEDHETHTRTDSIKVHRAALTPDGKAFAQPDEIISMTGEPGHDALCAREQDFVHRAITEDIDLGHHMDDAVASLRICLAADESVRSGQPVKL